MAEPDEIPLETDVVVVGAGPAGATLGYLLAQRGRDVVVLERAPDVPFKIGESLLPAGIDLCHRMGLEATLRDHGFVPKLAAQFILPDGERGRFPFSDGLPDSSHGSLAYEVKRREFDTILVDHARSAGARVYFDTRVADLELHDGGARLDLADGRSISARFLVDATGQAHWVARKLGLARPIAGLGKAAIFAHFDGIPHGEGEQRGDIVVFWGETSWVWIIPFSDGTTSVGAVADPATLRAAGKTDQERFDTLCSLTEHHGVLLGERRALMPLERRADFSYECERLCGPRFALTGDASGFIDPIFSTGVFLAQQSAFLIADPLAAALDESRPLSDSEQAHYTATLRKGFERFRSMVQGSYDHGFVQRAVKLRRRRGMRAAFTSLLAGDVFDDDNPLITMGLLERGMHF